MAQTDIGGVEPVAGAAAQDAGEAITRTHYMLVITAIGAVIIIVVAALFMSLF